MRARRGSRLSAEARAFLRSGQLCLPDETPSSATEAGESINPVCVCLASQPSSSLLLGPGAGCIVPGQGSSRGPRRTPRVSTSWGGASNPTCLDGNRSAYSRMGRAVFVPRPSHAPSRVWYLPPLFLWGRYRCCLCRGEHPALWPMARSATARACPMTYLLLVRPSLHSLSRIGRCS